MIAVFNDKGIFVIMLRDVNHRFHFSPLGIGNRCNTKQNSVDAPVSAIIINIFLKTAINSMLFLELAFFFKRTLHFAHKKFLWRVMAVAL